jgi:hypothetical protein
MRYREFGSAFVSELIEFCALIVVPAQRLWIEEVHRVPEKQPRKEDDRDNSWIPHSAAQPIHFKIPRAG